MSEKKENCIDTLSKAIEKANVKITFGLQPNQIKRIESEINRWDLYLEEDEKYLRKGWIKYDLDFWRKLGDEFGWESFTLALYYFEHLEDCRNKNN